MLVMIPVVIITKPKTVSDRLGRTGLFPMGPIVDHRRSNYKFLLRKLSTPLVRMEGTDRSGRQKISDGLKTTLVLKLPPMSQSPPTYRTLVIISLALHVSLGIYIFIPFFLATQNQWVDWTHGWVLKPEQAMLLWAFVGASAFSAIMVVMIPRLMTVSKKPEDPMVAPRRNQGEVFLDFGNFTPRIFIQTIVRLALAESIAIYGLVLAFVNQAPWWVVPFTVAALSLQVLFGPLVKIQPSSIHE